MFVGNVTTTWRTNYMNEDLTIIFLTVNTVPDGWVEYHKSILLEAADGAQIITISRRLLDWGDENLIQDAEPSVLNIYKQVLRGAKLANTPYIAIAEDDHLYPKQHFQYRPPENTFGYDGSRWGLFTWGTPTFYHKKRISNGSMVAPRDAVIDSLEERFRRHPTNNRIGELGKEKGTKLDRKESVFFWSTIPTIFLSHVNALDKLEQEKRKRMSMIRAYDIPYWGKANEIASKFV